MEVVTPPCVQCGWPQARRRATFRLRTWWNWCLPSPIYTIYIIHRDLRTLWRTTQEQLRHVFSFLYFWRHISPSSPLLALLTAPPPPQHPPVASSKYLLVPPSFVCKHMGSDKVAASTSNTTQSSNWTIIFIIQQLPMKDLKSHLVWAHLHPLHDSEKYKQPRQTSLHLLQRNTLWHFPASSPYLQCCGINTSWFSSIRCICSIIPV